jgi:ketosteroid isomerase-like protein
MSQENVEIVLAAFEAWNRGDSEGFDALHHGEIVLVAPEGWPEPRIEGREASHRQFARLKDAWSDDRIEIDHVEDAGDKVLVDWRLITIGKSSGIAAEKTFTSISTVREGLITRVEYFFDREKALKAAGLSE